MRSIASTRRLRKPLICGVLWLLAAGAAVAQPVPDISTDRSWIQSPYRNFGPPTTLLAGRAVLFDEGDDPAVAGALATELRRLFAELYGQQGWRSPFAEGQPVRIFLARKGGDGARRVTARAREDGRLVGAAILLDAGGLTEREIVREVSRQVALATLRGYAIDDGSFVTEAAAELIAGAESGEDDDAFAIAAAAPELSIDASPLVLGRLYLAELVRGAGPDFLRDAWETAEATEELIFPVLLRAYAERTGETQDAPLVRFGARLYTTLEPEAAPSRVGLADLEAGALDAAAPSGFTLRHRTYLPGDGASALRVSWPEDGAAGAVVVRYRDADLPPDVLFLAAGDVRTIPLGGVARVDWVVAGSSPGATLRAPAEVQSAPAFPFAGLVAHAAGGPGGAQITWTTASHEGLAGWAIFREEVLADGRIARTGPEVLPSSKGAQEPFAYAHLDPSTSPATFYRYTIWAVTEDGLLSRAFSVTLRTSD